MESLKTSEFLEVGDDVWSEIPPLFDKTEKSFEDDVKALKKWMETQSHLPEILGDKEIKNFLILNKDRIEITKQKIDMYYTIKTVIPDVYKNINPQSIKLKEMLDIVYWTPLPKLTPEMYRVFVFKLFNKPLINTVSPYDVLRHYINIQEIRLKEDVMFGEVIIGDCKDLSLWYICKWTPRVLSRFLTVCQKVYSVRVKAAYIINAPSFFSILMAILKRIVKPKLFERMHVCSDESILHERLPKEILPKEYGGLEKSLEVMQKTLKEKLSLYQSRFDRLDEMKVDESLRPDALRNN